MALLAIASLAASWDRGFDVLYETESPYHHVRVTEEDGFRYLSFDETRGTQSAMKLSDPLFLQYMYARLAFAGLVYVDNPSDVMFVGLGGGSMPKFLRHHYPEVNIDIAEIDPVIVEVAKKYFEFEPDDKTQIYVKDGRVVLSKIKKQYDIIFLDAYNTRSIPFHLTTREFLETVRERLKPGGVVVSNIWSPRLNRYFEAEIKTFQVVFPELYIYPALNSGNYIFISPNRPGRIYVETLVDRAERLQREKDFDFDLAGLIQSMYRYATRRPCDARILTDEQAPVNVMRWQSVDEKRRGTR